MGCENVKNRYCVFYEGWTIYGLDSSWKEFLFPIDYTIPKKNIKSKKYSKSGRKITGSAGKDLISCC